MTHHYLLSSLIISHPSIAISYLHSLEKAGLTPLLETYTVLIKHLLRPKSTPQLIARGWDLYAHTRLVAYPVPDVGLFSTMIQACSRGSQSSPERANDLFVEMTVDNGLPPSEEAYNGLIRSYACEGSIENYFEALRYMRQMLDNNVEPSKHTFHALLEGARRHGDLARARWMLVKMVEVGGKSEPDSNSIGRVLQTYASYKVPVKGGGGAKKSKSSIPLSSQVSSSSSTSTSPRKKNSAPEPKSFTSTHAILKVMGESSLDYPGPLPQTSEELLLEARILMLQCVSPHVLDSNIPLQSAFNERKNITNSLFPNVVPSTFLLNSYFELLAMHAPFPVTVDFFNHAFVAAGIEKNRFSFERMITQCEMSKNKEHGMKVALETFGEWKEWCSGTSKLAVGEGAGEKRKVKEGEGKNISKMWASMIRNLAR